ncbi:MAG: DinB family protein, partial [Candidatus Krumholzibacteriia bacterium]
MSGAARSYEFTLFVVGEGPNSLLAQDNLERICAEYLQAAFDAGDAAVRDAVLDAVRDGRRFEGAYESHPAQLMVHCVVHDAHHRGQILALLRQAGRGAEERERLEEATWPIWR